MDRRWKSDSYDGASVLFCGNVSNQTYLEETFGQKQTITELLCCAFRKWGLKLQSQLIGEFALVAYDSVTKHESLHMMRLDSISVLLRAEWLSPFFQLI